jgi:hypothetical protein
MQPEMKSVTQFKLLQVAHIKLQMHVEPIHQTAEGGREGNDIPHRLSASHWLLAI